jgi:hypothetical protein
VGGNGFKRSSDAPTVGASLCRVHCQRRQYDLNRADYSPYITSGQSAVNQLAAGLAPGGRFSTPTPFDFQYDQNTDPGYGFRFDQGMRGVNAQCGC